MKYQEAIQALHDNHELFTFDAIIASGISNYTINDLLTNNDGDRNWCGIGDNGEAIEISAYHFIASMDAEEEYRGAGKRAIAHLIKTIVKPTPTTTAIIEVAKKRALYSFNSTNEDKAFLGDSTITLEDNVKWWEIEVAAMQAIHDKEQTEHSVRNLTSYKADLEAAILILN